MLDGSHHQSLTEVTSHVNNILSTPISTSTVRHVLHNNMDMHGYVAAQKPFLKPVHRAARWTWANDHQGWGIEDWKSIIWTDESTVEIGKHSGRVWVWRRPGERYDERCTVPTFKSRRQSLMVWGCIAHGRHSPLFRVPKEEQKGPDYICNILAGVLWGFYKKLYRERGIVAIMEDGAPVHRSKVTKNFHVEHKIEVLPHPAQSPDLNPIEHIWT